MSSRESNKLSHELTDEELLAQLNSEEDSIFIDGVTDAVNFCATFDLRSGKVAVARHLLYQLYRIWSSNPLPTTKFYPELNKFFTKSSGRYMINKEPLALGILKQELEKKKKIIKAKNPKWALHFKGFLDHYSLAKGKTWIEGDILFWLYEKWCYSTKKTLLLSYHQFSHFLKINFKVKQTKTHLHWYQVNTKLFNHLSTEFIEDFRDKRKIRNAKKGKKENKKKPEKISSV